jgi:hypothetical protein
MRYVRPLIIQAVFIRNAKRIRYFALLGRELEVFMLSVLDVKKQTPGGHYRPGRPRSDEIPHPKQNWKESVMSSPSPEAATIGFAAPAETPRVRQGLR